MKGGYVEPEYVQAMLDREKLTPTYLGESIAIMGESIAVPHGTVEAKERSRTENGRGVLPVSGRRALR